MIIYEIGVMGKDYTSALALLTGFDAGKGTDSLQEKA
jgi:hypothetical protein